MLLGRLLALWALWKRVLRRDAREGRVAAQSPGEVDPSEREVPANAQAEGLVATLLFAATGFFIAFVVLYIVYDNTPLLGATAGVGLLCLAVALMVASLAVVPQVTEAEERKKLDKEMAEEIAQEIRSGGEGISRRKLIGAAAGACGCGVCALAIAPAASLGPRVGDNLSSSPWRRGRRLVDSDDKPIAASDMVVGSFVTAFPEGADKRDLAASLIVVRLERRDVHMRAQRRTWAPEGIVAYSKICTHAGCAVSEFRYPLYQPTAPHRPALVCPCHYSTFDAGNEGEVMFGPAGRPLPQLPLTIDGDGHLRAGGDLSDVVGPAWFGVRTRT